MSISLKLLNRVMYYILSIFIVIRNCSLRIEENVDNRSVFITIINGFTTTMLITL